MIGTCELFDCLTSYGKTFIESVNAHCSGQNCSNLNCSPAKRAQWAFLFVSLQFLEKTVMCFAVGVVMGSVWP